MPRGKKSQEKRRERRNEENRKDKTTVQVFPVQPRPTHCVKCCGNIILLGAGGTARCPTCNTQHNN